MHHIFTPVIAAAFTASAMLAAASLSAEAQTPLSQTPGSQGSAEGTSPSNAPQQSPAAKPGDKSGTESLSKKLDKNDGVLKPPKGVDPGIHEKTPATGDKMPVIIPPGEPGGDQSVQPK